MVIVDIQHYWTFFFFFLNRLKQQTVLSLYKWYEGPACDIMGKAAGSHMVGALINMPGVCAYMLQILREWSRRDCSITIPPGGAFLSYPLGSACAL